jgi:hypothetical protein
MIPKTPMRFTADYADEETRNDARNGMTSVAGMETVLSHGFENPRHQRNPRFPSPDPK